MPASHYLSCNILMLWKVNLLKFGLTAFHKLSINLTLILKSIKRISSVGAKVNDVYIIAPSKCNFECHLPIISGGFIPWVVTPGFCYALNAVVRVVARLWLGFYRSSCDDLGWLTPTGKVTITHGQTSGPEESKVFEKRLLRSYPAIQNLGGD